MILSSMTRVAILLYNRRCLDRQFWSNNVDTEQTSESDQGLYYLPLSLHLLDA